MKCAPETPSFTTEKSEEELQTDWELQTGRRARQNTKEKLGERQKNGKQARESTCKAKNPKKGTRCARDRLIIVPEFEPKQDKTPSV